MSSKQEDQHVSVEEIVALTKVVIGYLRYMFETQHIRWEDFTLKEQRALIRLKNKTREIYLLLAEEKQRRAFRDSGGRRKRK